MSAVLRSSCEPHFDFKAAKARNRKFQAAAVDFDKVPDDRKTKPRTGAFFIKSAAPAERFRGLRVRNSGTVIFNEDGDCVTVSPRPTRASSSTPKPLAMPERSRRMGTRRRAR
ncbi:MAG: hypothetical protein JWO64_1710, partial [Hyphomicrobiales bacterium]|nr:hypothetical protein [Hyphomicrobiales bacterium]